METQPQEVKHTDTPNEAPHRGVFRVGEIEKLIREIERDLRLIELYHHDIDVVIRYTDEIRRKLNKILETLR